MATTTPVLDPVLDEGNTRLELDTQPNLANNREIIDSNLHGRWFDFLPTLEKYLAHLARPRIMLTLLSSVLDSPTSSVPAESDDDGEDLYGSDQWLVVLQMVKARMTPAELRECIADESRQDEAWLVNRLAELKACTDHALHVVTVRLRERAHLLRTRTFFSTALAEHARFQRRIEQADEGIRVAAQAYRVACSVQGVDAAVLLPLDFGFDDLEGTPQYID
jgi:hypothetical protein